jgi:hypothetical protein
MKKTFLFMAVMAIVATLPSCDKAAALLFKPFESPLSFDVNIAPTAAGTTTTLGTQTVAYNLNNEVSTATNGAFSGDFITQIYVNQIGITLSNTDATNNLSNFETVSLQVTSGTSTPVVLGPFTVPAGTTTTYTITATNSPNIRQYFSGANVTFALIGKTKTATTKTLAANVRATLKFDK